MYCRLPFQEQTNEISCCCILNFYHGMSVAIRWQQATHEYTPSYTSVNHIQNENDFRQYVINCTEKTVLLNFWTWWSDPCNTMSATFHSLNPLLSDQHSIVCADWDRQRWLGHRLQIYGVPTLLIFENGQVKLRISGVISPGELLTCLTDCS